MFKKSSWITVCVLFSLFSNANASIISEGYIYDGASYEMFRSPYGEGTKANGLNNAGTVVGTYGDALIP